MPDDVDDFGRHVHPVNVRYEEIAWTVRGQLNLGHVYGYRLEPIEEGTLVTSYYPWLTVPGQGYLPPQRTAA
ncbi:MAG: hypothetical protein ACRDPY_36040 [Streptosporangiaceae bacterium]